MKKPTNYDRHLEMGIPMIHSLDYSLAFKAGVGEPGKMEGTVMVLGNIYLQSDKAEIGAIYPKKVTDLGISLVTEFHHTFNCHIGEAPGVPVVHADSRGLILLYQKQAAALGEKLKNYAASRVKYDPEGALLLIRLQLIQEELAELAEAMADTDTVGALDALVDLSYVVDGTYITLGLHSHKAEGLLEVHRSNMSKLDDEGNPIISDAGRVVKGPNYSPPNLKALVDGRSE